MKRHILISALLAVSLLISAHARADGLTTVGHYNGADGSFFEIATYLEDGETVGVMGISHKVSVAFSKTEWHSFVELWRRAESVQSNSFQFVGTYKETNTTYNSLLTVAAGPGVQFTINDQPGTLVFVLSPGDYASFDAAVGTVSATLAASLK